MNERLLLIIMLLLPGMAGLFVAMLALVLALLPREQTRQIRHRLANFVLWQWIKGSKISAWAHEWLWQEGNGKKPEKKMEKYLDE